MSTAKRRVRAPATRKSTALSASPTKPEPAEFKIDKLTAQHALKRLRQSGAWPPAPAPSSGRFFRTGRIKSSA